MCHYTECRKNLILVKFIIPESHLSPVSLESDAIPQDDYLVHTNLYPIQSPGSWKRTKTSFSPGKGGKKLIYHIRIISSTNFNAQFNNNMYVTLLSSTCFGPWHAHPQEEQLHKHSIWYPRSHKQLYTTLVESSLLSTGVVYTQPAHDTATNTEWHLPEAVLIQSVSDEHDMLETCREL